jgi:hypothetical protein
MLELGFLIVLLAGLGLVLSLAVAILGLVFKVILIPLQIGFWLMKGILGLALGLLGLVFVLPVIGVALPVLLVVFAVPLALIALIVYAIKGASTVKA